MIFPWWKKKSLRMVWRLDKGGSSSFLVGTAHFSHFHFRRSLTALLDCVETVLFEGPLDEASMARVSGYGREAGNCPSLYEALDPAVIRKIRTYLDDQAPRGSAESYRELLGGKAPDFLEANVKGARPWMAFFALWTAYLNWNYSLDMEAYHLAQKMGKKVNFLETIEEQLEALDGVPFEGIVDYVNRFEHWRSYKEQFFRDYLEGDIDRLMSRTTGFPTRCESILGRRDERFFKKMKAFVEAGATIAFLGLSHIAPVKKMFLDEGYRITQETI
jgi:uncharacterized protein YbaP (TraB family)